MADFHLRIPVRRFNRLCYTLSLLWLAVTVPLGILLRPTMPDFAQFYIGGIIARQGKWNALYPVPAFGSLDNPGLRMHSWAKPGWVALSRIHGVVDYTHFILPPPSALLFIPFSWMSYPVAFWVWTFILSACVWGVALIAGRLYRCIVGSPTRCEGVLALLIVLSPMTARSVRIANVSPPIALLLGIALLGLVRQEESLRGTGAVLVGALLKYATLIFAPLLLAMRRWRMLAWLAGLGALSVLVTLLIAGPWPFVEFYRIILPTLSRPSWYYGNQSLPGLLARIFGRPLSPKIAFALTFMRVVSLEAVLILILTVKRGQWRNPVYVFSGAALLVGWLLIFSPIAWEHWPIFLCPVWGWLLWEARRKGLRRLIALSSLALMYLPAGIIQVTGIATYPLIIPEPFNSTQLLGVILLAGLASWRISRAEPEMLSEPASIEEVTQMGQLKQVE